MSTQAIGTPAYHLGIPFIIENSPHGSAPDCGVKINALGSSSLLTEAVIDDGHLWRVFSLGCPG